MKIHRSSMKLSKIGSNATSESTAKKRVSQNVSKFCLKWFYKQQSADEVNLIENCTLFVSSSVYMAWL